jgi:hypothetical protein
VIPEPLYWTLAFGGLAALLVPPTIIALARRADGIHLVLGFSALGLVSIFLLPVAWWLAFRLPAKRPVRRPPRVSAIRAKPTSSVCRLERSVSTRVGRAAQRRSRTGLR